VAQQVCSDRLGMLPGAGKRREVARVGQISAEGFSRDHPVLCWHLPIPNTHSLLHFSYQTAELTVSLYS